MSSSNVHLQNDARKAGHTARSAANSRESRAFVRFGYAAKGVIYLIIGALAGKAAIGIGGATTDQHGAIQAIYQQPFGRFLLAIVTIGFFGFALWSLAQAIFDTEGKGTDAKGIVTRIGYGVVGLIYLGLGATALKMVLGAASNSGQSSNTSAQDWTARLLSAPAGVALVVIVALIMFGVTAAMFYRAYAADFRQNFNFGAMSATVKKVVMALGRIGYAALGVVFAVVGIFLLLAGFRHNPGEAKGLSGALQTIAQQPFGHVLLALVALGLIAYGVFSFAEARYRQIGSI